MSALSRYSPADLTPCNHSTVELKSQEAADLRRALGCLHNVARRIVAGLSAVGPQG